jgi:hypothetical protein
MLKAYFKVMSTLLFIFVQVGIILPTLLSSNDWFVYSLGWFLILVINPVVLWWVLRRVKLRED